MMASGEPVALVLEAVAPGARLLDPPGLKVGEALPLPQEVHGRWVTLGAGARQDLRVRDEPPGIGRSHLRFIRRGGGFLVQGRLHPHGYVLDGEAYHDCTPRPLRDGAILQIGPHVRFRVRLPAENPGGPAEPPEMRAP
jgi:hypothetical protein